jgi:hypothetical protein
VKPQPARRATRLLENIPPRATGRALLRPTARRGDLTAQRRTSSVVAAPAQRPQVRGRTPTAQSSRSDMVGLAVLPGQQLPARWAGAAEGSSNHLSPCSPVSAVIRRLLCLRLRCPAGACLTRTRVGDVLPGRRTRSAAEDLGLRRRREVPVAHPARLHRCLASLTCHGVADRGRTRKPPSPASCKIFSHAVFFSNLPSALERQELTYEKNKGAKHGARIDHSCVADRWRWHGRCGRRAVHKRYRAEARTEMTNAGVGARRKPRKAPRPPCLASSSR